MAALWHARLRSFSSRLTTIQGRKKVVKKPLFQLCRLAATLIPDALLPPTALILTDRQLSGRQE
jgi:hypothetical protein